MKSGEWRVKRSRPPGGGRGSMAAASRLLCNIGNKKALERACSGAFRIPALIKKLWTPSGAPHGGAACVRRASIFAAGKNLGGLRPQARFGAQPPLAAALGAKMAEFTAQPLAALPPYGCGVPLAGISAEHFDHRRTERAGGPRSPQKRTSRGCPPFPKPAANPAKRIAAGSEEKARPAYEKALRHFHRLRAFSELVTRRGFEPRTHCLKGSCSAC